MANWEELENDLIIFFLSVDGTHCPIQEPQPYDKKWFSSKLNGPGVNYEIGLKIYKSELLWVNGPFPCGELNDIKTFRLKGLKDKIPIGKRVIADKGYRGEPDLISTENKDFDERELAEFKERVTSRHESFNKRIKVFRCLTTPCRHGVDFHGMLFRACCVIICYEMENGSPLFDPYP